ncbi:MAG: hypothetical protein JNJ69_11445 [Leptospiraceae bacterium]|nr:hypothetical protein [Leptospiraceae bacterium]
MKKSRKDIFRKAVADNLSDKGQESSELGDFVSDMRRSRSENEQDASPLPEEAAKSEGKNDLPQQKEEKETGRIMESRLKRLTAGPSQPAAFADDDEPPRWRRYAVFGVVGLLVLSLMYWAFFSPGSRPTIYLSNTAIEETTAKNLATTNLSFPRNKTVYLLFSSGGRLGQEKLITRLTEVYSDSSNMMKEETMAQIEGSVKSNWRYFTTQFQKENFDHAGRFRIHVLAPNGEVLASQEFRVQ